MKKLNNKLKEIIDDDMKQKATIWTLEIITEVQNKYAVVFPKDYVFYLQHYGNNYVKEGYGFKIKASLEKEIGQDIVEIDSIFGLYDNENNLEKKIIFYKGIIPQNLFPIADLPGGDLICMNKENYQIYFWFHDKIKDTYLVAHSFSDFIMQFQFVQIKKISVDDVELNFSDDLDALLKKASNKLR